MSEENPSTVERRWVRVTECGNVPVREGRATVLAGRSIAIFNLGDRFLALENRCPHRGGPLAEGIVSGSTVVCPLHAWKIDLETGVARSANAIGQCVETFPTRVENGVLEIELPLTALPPGEACGAEHLHHDRPIRWVQRKFPAAPASAPELS